MLKISILRKTFRIDDVNDSITCRLEITTNNKIINRILFRKGRGVITSITYKHPNDKLDFNIGTKVALAKAERTAYRYVKEACKEFISFTEENMKDVTSFIPFADKIIDHNTEYIKKQ